MFTRFAKIDNNLVRKNLDGKTERRALSIYTYLLNEAGEKGYVHTTLNSLLWIFRIKSSSGNKASFAEALSTLCNSGVISVRGGYGATEDIEPHDLVKSSNSTVTFHIEPSSCSDGYALIPSRSLEKIFSSPIVEDVSDHVAVLVYLCMGMERRKNMIPVYWEGMTNISANIHMKKEKTRVLINQLIDLSVLCAKTISTNKNGYYREHRIYAIKEDEDLLSVFSQRAERANSLYRELKFGIDSTTTNSNVIDLSLRRMLDSLSFEWNGDTTKRINEYQEKRSLKELVSTVSDSYARIAVSDNPTGYILRLLEC